VRKRLWQIPGRFSSQTQELPISEVRCANTKSPVADRLAVDPSQLRAAARSASVLADDHRGLLGGLAKTLSEAAEVSGNPQAGNAILRFGARWAHDLGRFTDQVDGIQDGLALSASAYEQRDQANAQDLRRVEP
jgi:hypothetical protein